MKKITHIIYDMDGLLLNTEIYYTEVSQIIAARYGKTFDWSVKSRMIGMASQESAKVFVSMLDIPLSPEDYLTEKNALLRELFPKADPMPGAKALTAHFKQHGVPQAIGTSSALDLFKLKVSKHLDWIDTFDHVVTSSHPEVKRGKPAPDIFLTAAKALSASPESCLVFEDAPSGVSAAKAAGMSVIAVPDPNMDRTRYDTPDLFLDSLEDFDPVPWGLPKR